MPNKMTASDSLAQLENLPLDRIDSFNSLHPKSIQAVTYLQLMNIIEELEHESGVSITQGPLPILTHTKNEAYEAIKDIMFYRIGQVRLVRGVIKEQQIKTLGQLVATIRSLEKIAELE
jgi:hypothetical protein